MRAFLPCLLLLAACSSEPEADPADDMPGAPPPPQLCEQSRKALEAIGAKAGIDYDDRGEGIVAQEAWLRMQAAQRSQFAQLLAFHAACAHPDGAGERRIVIRNEWGNVVVERIVPTAVGLGTVPEE
jgi:hypothetical protein